MLCQRRLKLSLHILLILYLNHSVGWCNYVRIRNLDIAKNLIIFYLWSIFCSIFLFKNNFFLSLIKQNYLTSHNYLSESGKLRVAKDKCLHFLWTTTQYWSLEAMWSALHFGQLFFKDWLMINPCTVFVPPN